MRVRLVAKDIHGDFVYGKTGEVTGKALEEVQQLAEMIGKWDKFSMIDENGDTVGLRPENLIWVKVENLDPK